MKSAGMLPDKYPGSVIMGSVAQDVEPSFKILVVSHDRLCFVIQSRFCRSGRPRKMKPEKLRVVLEERNPVLSDDEGILSELLLVAECVSATVLTSSLCIFAGYLESPALR